MSSEKGPGRWIDLGIHTEACMSQPYTCGENGGAVSLWYRVITCPSLGGIISSFSGLASSGFSIYCGHSTLG